MPEIDFEKIRQDAINEKIEKYPDDPFGRILRSFTEIASHVTKDMLIEYEKQRSQCDQQ